MNRKLVFSKIDQLTECYCEGCWLKHHFRKENGKNAAHQFCIQQCTVGEKLKELGAELTNRERG
ncbi:zinc-finger domain-containing protein [Bacillus spongiae]|uniref:Zinc-finger domain-containing protein n=1 Tax=Bacillus spongiae TaxID=2683610 RepID=A0ABU8HDB9_9BACI